MHLNQPLAGFLGLLFTGLSSAAPLQNGDFSSFEGWSGERTYSDSEWNIISSTISGNDLDSAVDSDDNFQRNATAGTGTAANSSTYWSVDLFQEFTVPDAGGGTVWLSFDYEWSMTTWSMMFEGERILVDQVFIGILDTDFSPLVDLVGPSFVSPLVAAESNSGAGSLSYDMTAYSNQNVILSAYIADGDYDEQDSVTIGNIAFQVPAPPTALLLLAGFPLIMHWRVRNKG